MSHKESWELPRTLKGQSEMMNGQPQGRKRLCVPVLASASRAGPAPSEHRDSHGDIAFPCPGPVPGTERLLNAYREGGAERVKTRNLGRKYLKGEKYSVWGLSLD